MFKYAQEKTGDLWGGIRGDMLVTLVTLIAAYFASTYDWFGLKARFHVGSEFSLIIHFVLAGMLLMGGSFCAYLLYSAIMNRKISFDVEFSTKPGRNIFGRYLSMFIYNKSAANVESCWVILKNVETTKGDWNPPDAINRRDSLLWGSKMRDREGKKTIKKNNNKDTLVDILHTSDKEKGGRVYFTQQHVGEIISAPPGSYRFDLEIYGKHLGREFNIPVSATFTFNGGMVLSKIKPNMRRLDKRIKSVTLEFDKKVTEFKNNKK